MFFQRYKLVWLLFFSNENYCSELAWVIKVFVYSWETSKIPLNLLKVEACLCFQRYSFIFKIESGTLLKFIKSQRTIEQGTFAHMQQWLLWEKSDQSLLRAFRDLPSLEVNSFGIENLFQQQWNMLCQKKIHESLDSTILSCFTLCLKFTRRIYFCNHLKSICVISLLAVECLTGRDCHVFVNPTEHFVI